MSQAILLSGYWHFSMPYSCISSLYIKSNKMKSFTMLMMAALTILSVSVFAQDSTKHKMKVPKQKTEKTKYSCPMHPNEVNDKAGKCSQCGMDLALSPKEKMKM